MPKDPTANSAARNVGALQRAARLDYMEDGYPARLWLDVATFRGLGRLVIELRDDDGNRHIRFNEEARQLLEQLTGQAPRKGTNS